MSKCKTLKELWSDLSIHSQQALVYDEDKYALGSKDIHKEYLDKEILLEIINKLYDESSDYWEGLNALRREVKRG